MNRLETLEKIMRPNFIFDGHALKVLQTLESYEGSKDLARTVFVGIADMYGFEPSHVQEYLDMEYQSWRSKLKRFRAIYTEATKYGLNNVDTPTRKMYNKTMLCLNAIKWKYNRKPFISPEEWLDV